MTIYYNKYGAIIHGNPDEYFRLESLYKKYGHFKLKNYIKKEKEELEPKKIKSIIDTASF